MSLLQATDSWPTEISYRPINLILSIWTWPDLLCYWHVQEMKNKATHWWLLDTDGAADAGDTWHTPGAGKTFSDRQTWRQSAECSWSHSPANKTCQTSRAYAQAYWKHFKDLKVFIQFSFLFQVHHAKNYTPYTSCKKSKDMRISCLPSAVRWLCYLQLEVCFEEDRKRQMKTKLHRSADISYWFSQG